MLSFLKTYLGVSGEVTTVCIHVVVPKGRKATTYPNPSPFCNSSGMGCEKRKQWQKSGLWRYIQHWKSFAGGKCPHANAQGCKQVLVLHMGSFHQQINSGTVEWNTFFWTYCNACTSGEVHTSPVYASFSTKCLVLRYHSVNTYFQFLVKIHSSKKLTA